MSNTKGPDREVGPRGYMVVRVYGHPRALNGGFVYEHIIVMEKHLGRPIFAPEEIHHDNENRADNRPENLVLCKNRKEHMEIHAAKRLRAAGGDPETQRWCCGCGIQEKSAFSNSRKRMCRSCHATYEYERKHAA